MLKEYLTITIFILLSFCVLKAQEKKTIDSAYQINSVCAKFMGVINSDFIFELTNTTNDSVYLFDSYIFDYDYRITNTYDRAEIQKSKYLHRYDIKQRRCKLSFVPLLPYLTLKYSNRPIIVGENKIICHGQVLYHFSPIAPHEKLQIAINKDAVYQDIYVIEFDAKKNTKFRRKIKFNTILHKHCEDIVIEFAVFSKINLISQDTYYYDELNFNKQASSYSIVSISVNLPELICFMDERKIVNLYDATGRKHGTKYYKQDSILEYATWYDGHCERIDYTDTLMPSLYRIHHAEGYVSSTRDTATPPVFHYYYRDHLGNNCAVWNATTDNMVQRTLYYASGLPMDGSTEQNYQPYKYNGKEFVNKYGYDTYDYGFRGYYPAIGRFTSIDPLAEKYYSISPYAYCKNNSVNRIDPNGMDDYRYDDKTGEFHLMKQTADKTDRVLKYHLNKKTGEYEQNRKWHQAQTRIEVVGKGILSDGVNFMSNNNIIAIGGEGQASVDDVEAFVVNLSDMVGKEIGGAYFSKDGTSTTTHISIGRYMNNGYKITKGGYGHTLWNKLYPDSKLENSLTGFFHTHPSEANINVLDRTQPSQQDKKSRNADLQLMPNLQFYILTHPINYGDKFPLKIPYTTWP